MGVAAAGVSVSSAALWVGSAGVIVVGVAVPGGRARSWSEAGAQASSSRRLTVKTVPVKAVRFDLFITLSYNQVRVSSQ